MKGTYQERPKRAPTEVKKKKKKEHSSGSGARHSGRSVSDAPPNQVFEKTLNRFILVFSI